MKKRTYTWDDITYLREVERQALRDLGSTKTGRHKQRKDSVSTRGGVEGDEPFDYTSMLAPDAQVRLAEMRRKPE